MVDRVVWDNDRGVVGPDVLKTDVIALLSGDLRGG